MVERGACVSGLSIVRELDRIADLRGYRCMMVSDNGKRAAQTEIFRCVALQQQLRKTDIFIGLAATTAPEMLSPPSLLVPSHGDGQIKYRRQRGQWP